MVAAQVLAFVVGIVVGLAARGSVACTPLLYSGGSYTSFLAISPEAALEQMIAGAELIHRCAIWGKQFEIGTGGFALLGWGVPLLFGVIAWVLTRSLLRRRARANV